MQKGALVKYILFILVLILVEVFTYQAVNSFAKSLKQPWDKVVWWLYIILTICFWIFMISFPAIRNYNENRVLKAVISITLFGFLIFKVIVAAISSVDYLKRLIAWIISLFYAKENLPPIVNNAITRSTFIRNAALLLGGTTYGVVLSGMSNRYNYRTKKVNIPLANIPPAIKALKIIQISDVHSGSFTDVNAVLKGINQINALQPDLIFFTGDLVNNVATEMADYVNVFNKLKAKYGVYSTLGNHDYGDYVSWESEEAKANNLQDLKNLHKQMGWRLLLNENLVLEIDGSKLGIIGVENISGSRGFHTYGDLNKALVNLPNDTNCNILLSHDPSHWNKEVKDIDNINLTLSGHTHGMQFGLDLSWLKWSPVKYVYEQWAGLYNNNQQYLYVNRGFGFIGYPGRVGILPEITLITLG